MMESMLGSGMGYSTVSPAFGSANPYSNIGVSGSLSGNLGVGGGSGGQTGAVALVVLLGGLFILYWATRNIQGL